MQKKSNISYKSQLSIARSATYRWFIEFFSLETKPKFQRLDIMIDIKLIEIIPYSNFLLVFIQLTLM